MIKYATATQRFCAFFIFVHKIWPVVFSDGDDKAGIKAAEEIMCKKQIYLEAQSYATGFYEKEGFAVVGEEFLEDGIPHKPKMYIF